MGVCEIERRLSIDDFLLSGGEHGREFSEFMHFILYDSVYGYYSQGRCLQGGEGDYITAPSMTKAFAWVVSRLFEAILKDGSGYDIAEFGPGGGSFAYDVLSFLSLKKASLNSYYCLELSARQQEAQRIKLADIEGVEWRSDLPYGFKGIVFANEVLDAMPVSLIEEDEDGRFYKLGVEKCGKKGLCWTRIDGCDEVVRELFASREIPVWNNYRYEISEAIPVWLADLYEKMDEGWVVFFDYGYSRREYYHPQRSSGSLTCFYRHTKNSDPLLRPGEQDVSVHVDFTLVAEAASKCGFRVQHYATMASFLMHFGIEEYLQEQFSAGAGEEYRRCVRDAKTLLSPYEMGEVIKVMVLSKGEVEGSISWGRDSSGSLVTV